MRETHKKLLMPGISYLYVRSWNPKSLFAILSIRDATNRRLALNLSSDQKRPSKLSRVSQTIVFPYTCSCIDVLQQLTANPTLNVSYEIAKVPNQTQIFKSQIIFSEVI